MALTIDTRNVVNHKQVCYKKKTKDGYPYKDITYYLAWGSMAIGIGEITKKNYTEVYSRHKFLSNVSGLAGRFFNFDLRDVYDHIGLKTNVAFEKTTAWRNRIAKSEWQSIVFDTQEKASNINEIMNYGGTSE